jgi:uncharacterized radical SAM superfamily Fe-S cluster-containing enzyme
MDRDYILYDITTGICPDCDERVQAKVIIRNNKVYLKKFCTIHGEQEELLEEDSEYHKQKRNYDKPGTISKTQTLSGKGCPFDCGLCPQHDQHTCIGLIEITNKCNLNCPSCYADSGSGEFLPLSKINEMMDFLIESEGGQAEILQISGGEPTLHPELFSILELARKKNIKYLMLNTNGMRIADDTEFARKLGAFKGSFEIYLQFDGFKDACYSSLRGENILERKMKAIKHLGEYEIPMTLVSTISHGINSNEIGGIIKFGMDTPFIRGVNFQPLSFFGRSSKFHTKNRITLSGIISAIQEQLPDVFTKGDIVPLPCNTERVGVTYLAKTKKKKFVPITRDIKVTSYLPLIDNTFAFDADRIIREKIASSNSCECFSFLNDLKRIIPSNYALMSEKAKLNYLNTNTFRISITSFVDKYNFDLKSMQKECVHIITPELKKIPFSAYNMFYRK